MDFVCDNCFSDRELKAFIYAEGKVGNCDCCDSKESNIIKLDELLDFFNALLGNFEHDDKGTSLLVLLQEEWRFFTNDIIGSTILNSVLVEINTSIKDSNDKIVYAADIQENISYWEVLKNQLKWERRYLTNIDLLTQDLGWDGFFSSKISINKKDVFYRARIHKSSGLPAYNANKMFSPPPDYISSGRANPIGIPYLYLSDTIETVLYETRASFLDEVSIGRFRLKSDSTDKMLISDFTETPSLYQLKSEEVNNQIKSTLLKKIISKDLSKPMRRYDSPIDYIPTQFICEFIKIVTGVSGIKFRSSLHSKGNNIVLFDDGIMECFQVQKHIVKEVVIRSEEE